MAEQKNTGLIAGIIGLTILIFGGLVWAVARAPSQTRLPGGGAGQPEEVSFNDQGSPAFGLEGAKVVAHLYSDFQCPACRFAEPAVKAAMEAYKDRVRFIWKDFPLEQIHPNARGASNAARCAQDQGKFWEYHDALYASQTDWEKMNNPSGKFTEIARVLGLNEGVFTTCLTNRVHNDLVSRDVSEGLANRVDRTPTFFVNNRRYFGMNPADWSRVLDQALAETSSSSTN